MQIYIVRYNPFLYHLGLKLNVKPFPIICALLCLERNKYGKERFIVGCLVFIKWYVWSPYKGVQILVHLADTINSVAFSAFSWDFLSLLSVQCRSSIGILYFCLGFPFLSERREHKWCRWCIWDTSSILYKWCPGVLCGFCSLTWIKPGRCTVQPLLVVLLDSWPLPALAAWLRCLHLAQLDWDHCCSWGCSARDPDCGWKEYESLFCSCWGTPQHLNPQLPYTFTECFDSPKVIPKCSAPLTTLSVVHILQAKETNPSF